MSKSLIEQLKEQQEKTAKKAEPYIRKHVEIKDLLKKANEVVDRLKGEKALIESNIASLLKNSELEECSVLDREVVFEDKSVPKIIDFKAFFEWVFTGPETVSFKNKKGDEETFEKKDILLSSLVKQEAFKRLSEAGIIPDGVNKVTFQQFKIKSKKKEK